VAKSKKMTAGEVVKADPVVLPKSGKVTIIGTGGGLKGEYVVSWQLAETLIKKGSAELKQ